uniref:Uncharacterized protein n=1 Tax=Knipowitschia caucasica TaxID=637954 RepID=A0AAV2M0C5_KNICA
MLGAGFGSRSVASHVPSEAEVQRSDARISLPADAALRWIQPASSARSRKNTGDTGVKAPNLRGQPLLTAPDWEMDGACLPKAPESRSLLTDAPQGHLTPNSFLISFNAVCSNGNTFFILRLVTRKLTSLLG